MKIRRRLFIQTAAIGPLAAPLAAQNSGGGRARENAAAQGAPEEQARPVLRTVYSEAAAAPTPGFFTPEQFAALRRMSDRFLPAINGNPGAMEAGAPEFLDFYIGVSGKERQTLYKTGLDDLNARARSRFGKAFGDLTDEQADSILKPMFQPRGPLQAFLDPGPFVNRVYQDIRTVTQNSPAQAGRGNRGGLYWKKVDPTIIRG